MPTESLSYRNLDTVVLEEFPFLKDRVRRDLGGYEDHQRVGPYVLFGDVFNYYLREYISLRQGEIEKIGSWSVWLNRQMVEDLLKIEVLPVLLENQAILDAYWPYLGATTRQYLRELNLKNRSKIRIPS